MRQVTRKVMKAFLERRSVKTHTTWTNGEEVFLFGNRIAWRLPNGDISFTLAGHGTPTTRERLNGLCELLYGKRPFSQRDHEQYMNNTPIDTDWVITHHVLVPQELAA